MARTNTDFLKVFSVKISETREIRVPIRRLTE